MERDLTCFTESQSGSGWKGSLEIIQSNPLPKQVHLEQVAQDRVQAGFEYYQRRRLHKPSGQPVPVLCHPQRKEILPHVQTELSMLQFVPIAPCPVTGYHWKELGPILLTPTLQIFISIDKVPSQPSLLQAEQAQLPQPFLTGQMLQSIILVALRWTLSSSSSSFLKWGAQNWTQCSRWGLTRAE